MKNTVRIRRFKAAIGSVACVVVMLLDGNFSAKAQQPAAWLDSPAIRQDGQLQLKVRGIGNYVCELQGSQDLTNWFPLQQLSTDWFTNAVDFQLPVTNEWRFFRALGVRRSSYPLFQAGLMVRNAIKLNGNNFLSDSYDSSNLNYSSWVTNSTWGTNLVYSAAKRRDHGDVGAMLGITNAVTIGNVFIYGRLGTSPTGVFQIGPNGSVGDLTWQNSEQTGIQLGFSSSQMDMDFPAVAAPTGPGIPPLPGVYMGTNYDYMFSSSSTLYMMNSALSGRVCVTGKNIVLWAKGINFSGNSDGIYMAPGANVMIYVGNTTGANVSASFNGGGGVNANGYARNCQIYGLNTCTSILVGGSSSPFVGTIYAPNATVINAGAGNNTSDFIGAIIAKDVSLNGHWAFHYDETLQTNGPILP